jgi:shikimate kinase
MAWMNAHGETWYLKISVSELLRRLEPEQLIQRPILKGARPEDVRKEIETLLLQREKYYMQAHRVISEENANARYLSRYF